ncbi:unnamed protein product [Orchesella dallaii]|uniref:Uncharacterized protein n=1 Tax=Orchesella dallaii TaxID=48710 RepID=A0ABP1QRW3_9HEXA
MAMSPDTFLLVTICSGVFIIIVGMIIAINSPLKVLKCSFYSQQCGRLCRRMCCKKKEKNWKTNIINYSDNKKLSLIEGRPQGHGFYSAGPWSSTDTTSTCLGADTLHSSSLAVQSGLMSGAYFAMMNGSSGSNGITSANDNSSAARAPYGDGGGGNFFSTNYGIHGDNSGALNFGHSVCLNCHGAGFINPGALNMYQIDTGSSNSKNVAADYNFRQVDNSSQNSHLDGVSSGCLSASSDSMMAADDVDADADADIIICL